MKEKLIIGRKNIKGEDGYRVFSIRVKVETINELDKISAVTNRSRNELINVFLNYAINHCEIETDGV